MSDTIEPGGAELDGIEIDGVGGFTGVFLYPALVIGTLVRLVVFPDGGVSDVFYVAPPEETFLVAAPPETFIVAPGRKPSS